MNLMHSATVRRLKQVFSNETLYTLLSLFFFSNKGNPKHKSIERLRNNVAWLSNKGKIVLDLSSTPFQIYEGGIEYHFNKTRVSLTEIFSPL